MFKKKIKIFKSIPKLNAIIKFLNTRQISQTKFAICSLLWNVQSTVLFVLNTGADVGSDGDLFLVSLLVHSLGDSGFPL